MNEKNVGLFLGAGFSYELGLPIVNEATSEIRNFLTHDRIISFNDHWNVKKLGHSDEVINAFSSLVTNKKYNYENIIGALEVYANRHENTKLRQDYHGIKEWFIEFVWNIFSIRQVKNLSYIINGIKYYQGIKQLYNNQTKPMWVFSLNHDLVFEIIAKYYDLPLKSGLPDKYKIPKRDDKGIIIGELTFDYLKREDINNNRYNYSFKNNEKCINLLKLHGALDFFGKDDELNYVKLSLDNCTLSEYLRDINFLLMHMDQLKDVRATNHISYYDENNELQFLRKSLLSGAYKFDKRNSQIAPIEYLKLFSSYINYVEELIVIGYSFSDFHIDTIIRDWLTFSSIRHITIVNPFIDRIPNYFAHLTPQITLSKMSTTEYLQQISGQKNYDVMYYLRKFGRKRVYNKIVKKKI